jgi:ferritin-like metal-binding protein YciE
LQKIGFGRENFLSVARTTEGFRDWRISENPEAMSGILAPRNIRMEKTIMADETLKDLYIDELKDLYSAENQLVKALPKMSKAATSTKLKAGFEEHLLQTKGHVQRLETIFEQLEESPKGKKCKGMEGLIEEGSEAIEEYEGDLLDAALIGAAQRVEHYEMAGYGTVIAFGEELGEARHVSLLKETLEEEKATDEKLTVLAGDINAQANQGEEADVRAKVDAPPATKKKSRNAA